MLLPVRLVRSSISRMGWFINSFVFGNGAKKSADVNGNLRGAYLEGAYLQGAYLQGAYLQGAKISWSSHALLSEILWRAADTEARQTLAQVGRS